MRSFIVTVLTILSKDIEKHYTTYVIYNHVTFTTLPEMPTNFYSLTVPADAYFNGTIIINGVLTKLTWTSIYNNNGTISGYGYTTSANGHYTISHCHPNGKIYINEIFYRDSINNFI